MKNLKTYFLILAAFFVFSCDKDENEQIACCDFEVSYKTEYDLKNRWVVVGYIDNYSLEEECVENDEFEMDINFTTDSTFYAKSSCNSFQGSYELISENEIVHNVLMITEIACAEERRVELEKKYLHDLKYPRYFKIDGNKLTITSISETKWVFRVFK